MSQYIEKIDVYGCHKLVRAKLPNRTFHILDTEGNKITNDTYDFVGLFKYGYVAVRTVDCWWNYLNENGEYLNNEHYIIAKSFLGFTYDNYSAYAIVVTENNKVNIILINDKGEVQLRIKQ